MKNYSINCILCGYDKGKLIPFGYYYKEKYLWAVKCNKCGLITIQPQPTDDDIKEMYSEDYFTVADKNKFHGNTDYISSTEHADYTDKIKFFKKYVKSGNFLEIGCATGDMLARLRENGFNVTGIEISEFAAKTGNEKYNLNIINKPFTNELIGGILPYEHFDIVYMGDVLEHFRNPIEALRNINKILKKGGYVIVEVPSTLSLISSRLAFGIYNIIGKKIIMKLPPYHLTEFSPGSLKKSLNASGFGNISIKQECKHPSTIPLRHSWFENNVKLTLQYPNMYITRLFGVLGDRLTGIAQKQ